jgi:hypothetical protein
MGRWLSNPTLVGQIFVNQWSDSLVRSGEMAPIPDSPFQYFSLLLLKQTLRIDKEERAATNDPLQSIQCRIPRPRTFVPGNEVIRATRLDILDVQAF